MDMAWAWGIRAWGIRASVIVAAASLVACVDLHGLSSGEDEATQSAQSQTESGRAPDPARARGTGTPSGTSETGSSGAGNAPGSTPSACATVAQKTKDPFDRGAPAGNGWIPGNNGTGGMGIVRAERGTSASNVLLAHFNRRLEPEAWVQPVLQREVPATSCVAADFAILFAQEGPLDAEASTELFYIEGAGNAYLTLVRRESGALMAAGVDGNDKLVTQADFPRNSWTQVHLEVEIGKDDGAASVSFDGGAPRRLAGIPKLKAPIWVGIGGLSHGRTAAHDTLYDDMTLSY
jgi:hypothetical protein